MLKIAKSYHFLEFNLFVCVLQNYNIQQWGDWRQHLAMMVSNPTGHTQRDRSSIVALGDTLASRGQLHAAHFCYLVAEAEWGTYSNKSSQLVLIGSSHNLPFQVRQSSRSNCLSRCFLKVEGQFVKLTHCSWKKYT